MYTKNLAGQALGFSLINRTDGTPLTGATVTVYRVIDGGAQQPATGTVGEKGNSQYCFYMSAADCNGNAISFLFVAPSAVIVEKTILTSAAPAVVFRTEMDTSSTKLAAIQTGLGSVVLAAAGLDNIPVETGVNARQALSPILAASAGVLTGAGSGTIVIRGGNVNTTRITASTDNAGNRTSVTLALPA